MKVVDIVCFFCFNLYKPFNVDTKIKYHTDTEAACGGWLELIGQACYIHEMLRTNTHTGQEPGFRNKTLLLHKSTAFKQ